jgi:hypothetical protein
LFLSDIILPHSRGECKRNFSIFVRNFATGQFGLLFALEFGMLLDGSFQGEGLSSVYILGLNVGPGLPCEDKPLGVYKLIEASGSIHGFPLSKKSASAFSKSDPLAEATIPLGLGRLSILKLLLDVLDITLNDMLQLEMIPISPVNGLVQRVDRAVIRECDRLVQVKSKGRPLINGVIEVPPELMAEESTGILELSLDRPCISEHNIGLSIRGETLFLEENLVVFEGLLASVLEPLFLQLFGVLLSQDSELLFMHTRAAAQEAHTTLNMTEIGNVSSASAFRALSVRVIVSPILIDTVQANVSRVLILREVIPLCNPF